MDRGEVAISTAVKLAKAEPETQRRATKRPKEAADPIARRSLRGPTEPRSSHRSRREYDRRPHRHASCAWSASPVFTDRVYLSMPVTARARGWRRGGWSARACLCREGGPKTRTLCLSVGRSVVRLRDLRKKQILQQQLAKYYGGEGGIRTHGTLARTPDFESGPFGHSGTSPRNRVGRGDASP